MGWELLFPWNWNLQVQVLVFESFVIWQLLGIKRVLFRALGRWEHRFNTLGEHFTNQLVGRVVGDGVLEPLREGLAEWLSGWRERMAQRAARARSQSTGPPGVIGPPQPSTAPPRGPLPVTADPAVSPEVEP